MDVGHGRDPVTPELVQEQGPVRPADAPSQVGSVVAVGHPAAGDEGVEDSGERPGHTHHPRCQRRLVAQAGAVEEDFSVAGREAVAADLTGGIVLAGRAGQAYHGENAGDGLLFEPLLRVAQGDSSRGGQSRRVERPPLRQGPVEAKPVADIDVEQFEGVDGGRDDPGGEGVSTGHVVGGVAARNGRFGHAPKC